MKFRTLRSLGCEVMSAGFGTWPLAGSLALGGRSIGRQAISDDEAVATLAYAADRGINFFDTADAYGLGRSEMLLGKALGSRGIICSKAGNRFEGEAIVQDFSREWIMAAVESTLRRLKRDCLDILLLHSPPDNFGWRSYDSSYLDDLIAQGKIRAYGVSSSSSSSSYAGAKRVIEAGIGSVIELIYNAIDRRAGPVIAQAVAAGYDVLARMPLAYGLLLGGRAAGFGYGDHRSQIAEAETRWIFACAEELSFLRDTPGGMPVALIRFALGRDDLANVIVGMRHTVQVDDALEAMQFGDLPNDLVDRITAAVPSVFSGWQRQ